MVMNIKTDGRTWEQLLFIVLQKGAQPGRTSQPGWAIFQTLIVTWTKVSESKFHTF